MPIDVGKIIMLVLVITGFVIGIIFLKKTLDKNCTTGDIFDEKLGKCIPDCSLAPGTSYDSDKDACVLNCPAGSKMCGTLGCYDETQHCFNDKFICKVGDQLCPEDNGTGLPICFNPDKNKCIGGKVYPNVKACSETLGCETDFRCSNDGKTCIQCAEANGYCINSGKCCKSPQICDADGQKCTNCATGTTSCGNACYHNSTQICCDDKKTICNQGQTCCGEKCCDSGTSCVNGACCDSSKVYDIGNGQKACCASDLCDGKCCSDPNTTCHANKCMTKCGDEFCDITANEECLTIGPTTGPTTKKCIHTNCKFDDLIYDPPLLTDDTGKSLDVFKRFKGNYTKLYLSNPNNVYGLSRVSHVDTVGGTCNVNDCVNKLSQDNVEFLNVPTTYDTTGGNHNLGQCTATFGTDILNKPATCPWANSPERCCTDGGSLTGQVCNENQACINGTCFKKTYKCSTTDGKCVEYGTDVWDVPDGKGNYESANCNNSCLPLTSQPNNPDSIYVWCSSYDYYKNGHAMNCGGGYGNNAEQAHGICNNWATNNKTVPNSVPMPGLDYANYKWSCSPQFDSNTDVMENSDRHDPKCNCNGTLINCNLYQDEDRLHLPKGTTCSTAV